MAKEVRVNALIDPCLLSGGFHDSLHGADRVTIVPVGLE